MPHPPMLLRLSVTEGQSELGHGRIVYSAIEVARVPREPGSKANLRGTTQRITLAFHNASPSLPTALRGRAVTGRACAQLGGLSPSHPPPTAAFSPRHPSPNARQHVPIRPFNPRSLKAGTTFPPRARAPGGVRSSMHQGPGSKRRTASQRPLLRKRRPYSVREPGPTPRTDRPDAPHHHLTRHPCSPRARRLHTNAPVQRAACSVKLDHAPVRSFTSGATRPRGAHSFRLPKQRKHHPPLRFRLRVTQAGLTSSCGARDVEGRKEGSGTPPTQPTCGVVLRVCRAHACMYAAHVVRGNWPERANAGGVGMAERRHAADVVGVA